VLSFQIFSLPSLKANNKYKLTANEGSRVRRVGYVNFRSRSGKYHVYCICILWVFMSTSVKTTNSLKHI